MPEGAHLANKQRPEQRTKRTTAHDEEQLFFSDERIRKTEEKLFCGHGQHPSSGWNLRNRTRREKTIIMALPTYFSYRRGHGRPPLGFEFESDSIFGFVPSPSYATFRSVDL